MKGVLNYAAPDAHPNPRRHPLFISALIVAGIPFVFTACWCLLAYVNGAWSFDLFTYAMSNLLGGLPIVAIGALLLVLWCARMRGRGMTWCRIGVGVAWFVTLVALDALVVAATIQAYAHGLFGHQPGW